MLYWMLLSWLVNYVSVLAPVGFVIAVRSRAWMSSSRPTMPVMLTVGRRMLCNLLVVVLCCCCFCRCCCLRHHVVLLSFHY